MYCKIFNGKHNAIRFQLSFIVFFILLFFLFFRAQVDNSLKKEPGVVKAHSRGLHGYISYNADRPADRSSYSYGMGFYSAVWQLIT